jgi:hypothetical protein
VSDHELWNATEVLNQRIDEYRAQRDHATEYLKQIAESPRLLSRNRTPLKEPQSLALVGASLCGHGDRNW